MTQQKTVQHWSWGGRRGPWQNHSPEKKRSFLSCQKNHPETNQTIQQMNNLNICLFKHHVTTCCCNSHLCRLLLSHGNSVVEQFHLEQAEQVNQKGQKLHPSVNSGDLLPSQQQQLWWFGRVLVQQLRPAEPHVFRVVPEQSIAWADVQFEIKASSDKSGATVHWCMLVTGVSTQAQQAQETTTLNC